MRVVLIMLLTLASPLALIAGEAAPQKNIITPGGVRMVLIPSGSFTMGSSKAKGTVAAPHTVRLTQFYMDVHPVTQAEYQNVTGENPSPYKRPLNPVNRIRWPDAVRYANARSRAEGLEPAYDLGTWTCDFSKNGYRLPTEAEWEYAARAGTTTEYYFGDDDDRLPHHAWIRKNARRRLQNVMKKRPNPWGLYDVYGSLWEWCNDFYAAAAYQNTALQDPRGPKTGAFRVVRGGSITSSKAECRSWIRRKAKPGTADACAKFGRYGFRLVRTVNDTPYSTTAPAASKPPYYEPDIIDPRALSVPDEIQKGIFVDPVQYIKPLVDYLTSDAKNDFDRAKRLHDWIADNIKYDVSAYFGETEPPPPPPKSPPDETKKDDPEWVAGLKKGRMTCSGYAGVLHSGKTMCTGYSGLFRRMCEIANIECVVIYGHARGFGFNLFQPQSPRIGNHAWNAVKIGGRWHFVDCTWDAGRADPRKRKYVKRYATNYLFTDPKIFIYAHFPSTPRWQLLKKPLTADEFQALPNITGRFDSFGMTLPTPLLRVVDVMDEGTFTFEAPRGVFIHSNLYNEGQPIPTTGAFLQRKGTTITARVRFPKPGNYILRLFSKRAYLKSKDKRRRDVFFTVGFRSSTGAAKLLPWTYEGFVESDCVLYSPKESPLRANRAASFRIRIPGARKVYLNDAGRQKRFKRVKGEDDIFAIERGISDVPGVVWILAKTRQSKSKIVRIVSFQKTVGGR